MLLVCRTHTPPSLHRQVRHERTYHDNIERRYVRLLSDGESGTIIAQIFAELMYEDGYRAPWLKKILHNTDVHYFGNYVNKPHRI